MLVALNLRWLGGRAVPDFVTEYFKKAAAEYKTSTVAIVVLLLAALVCFFANLTLTNPAFQLP